MPIDLSEEWSGPVIKFRRNNMAEKKKGHTKLVGAKTPKGRSHKFKPTAKAAQHMEKPNKDNFNRADQAMNEMIKNKGIPRTKVGMN